MGPILRVGGEEGREGGSTGWWWSGGSLECMQEEDRESQHTQLNRLCLRSWNRQGGTTRITMMMRPDGMRLWTDEAETQMKLRRPPDCCPTSIAVCACKHIVMRGGGGKQSCRLGGGAFR